MKKIFIGVLIVFFFLTFASCGKEPGNKNEDVNVAVEDYGFTKESIKKSCDFKKENIYFRIVDNIRVYEPGADIGYLVYIDKPLQKDTDIEITFSNSKFKIKQIKTHYVKSGTGMIARYGSFSGDKNGVYGFKFTLKDSDSQAIKYIATKNIGIMPKATSVAGKDFYFGVQTFFQHVFDYNTTLFDNKTKDETYNLTWDYVDYIGANLIRDGSAWADQQIKEDLSCNFMHNDRMADDAGQRGVVFDMLLGGQPGWAVKPVAGQKPSWRQAPYPELWETYINTLAGHYKNYNNIIYEVCNECNWFDFLEATPEEYLNMLDIVVQNVHSVNPDAEITPGGMVTPNGSYTEDVESKTYYKHYKELLDSKGITMIPYHNHWGFQQFVNEMKSYRDKLSDNGIDKKYSFLNECGLESNGADQGYEVVKKALWAYGNDHRGFVLYCIRSTPGAGAGSLPAWGSVTERNEPKELYISYGNFIRQMDGAKLIKVYANDVYNAYLFEKHDKYFLVHFRGDSAPDAKIALGTDKYTVYDYLGNKLNKNQAILKATTVDKEPVFVWFDTKIDPELIKLDVNFVWENKIDFGW